MQPADSFLEVDPGRLAAVVDRIYPDSRWGPGGARLHLAEDITRQLGGAYGTGADSYASGPYDSDADPSFGWQRDESRLAFLGRGLGGVDTVAATRHGTQFTDLTSEQQDALLADIEIGSITESLTSGEWTAWFDLLLEQVFAALFITPVGGRYGTEWAWNRLLNGGDA